MGHHIQTHKHTQTDPSARTHTHTQAHAYSLTQTNIRTLAQQSKPKPHQHSHIAYNTDDSAPAVIATTASTEKRESMYERASKYEPVKE